MVNGKVTKIREQILSYKDCQKLILDSIRLFSKTTLILTALDETDVTIHNLAETLIEIMQKLSKPVKIFMSSRPKYHEAFEGWSTIDMDLAEQTSVLEVQISEASGNGMDSRSTGSWIVPGSPYYRYRVRS